MLTTYVCKCGNVSCRELSGGEIMSVETVHCVVVLHIHVLASGAGLFGALYKLPNGVRCKARTENDWPVRL